MAHEVNVLSVLRWTGEYPQIFLLSDMITRGFSSPLFLCNLLNIPVACLTWGLGYLSRLFIPGPKGSWDLENHW